MHAVDRPELEALGPPREQRGRALSLGGGAQLLHAFAEVRDAGVLPVDSLRLLLHGRVEQQDTDDAGSEHRGQDGGVERFAPTAHIVMAPRPGRGGTQARRENVAVVASLRGSLLVATPLLREATFLRTVIVVLDHDDEGAFGVVVNRPDGPPVDSVVPQVADLVAEPPVLFAGGPVSTQTGIALGLAAPGSEAEGWTPVSYPLVSVDLDHDPALLATSLQALRVFLGYAGWSPGQLEAEVETGAWYVVDAVPADCFSPQPQRLWADVLRRQGWPLSAVATCPIDPSMN